MYIVAPGETVPGFFHDYKKSLQQLTVGAGKQ
jgi:hypothetical protein